MTMPPGFPVPCLQPGTSRRDRFLYFLIVCNYNGDHMSGHGTRVALPIAARGPGVSQSEKPAAFFTLPILFVQLEAHAEPGQSPLEQRMRNFEAALSEISWWITHNGKSSFTPREAEGVLHGFALALSECRKFYPGLISNDDARAQLERAVVSAVVGLNSLRFEAAAGALAAKDHGKGYKSPEFRNFSRFKLASEALAQMAGTEAAAALWEAVDARMRELGVSAEIPLCKAD